MYSSKHKELTKKLSGVADTGLTNILKNIKKNGKDAFDGIGKSIKEAAQAGYDYIQVIDDIEDRENASLIRSAKLREEIENLKNVSKDQTKTNKERQDAAQSAFNKEIELFKLEKQFAGERTSAEKTNLASKIQNSKLSIKQKEEELQQWLMFDDTEINSAQEKDAAFKEFYDKNEAEFKNVQKMIADEIMQRAGFNQEVRRLLSQLSGFKKEIADDEVKKAKEKNESLNKLEKEVSDIMTEIDKDRAKSKSESINKILKDAEESTKEQIEFEKELQDETQKYIDEWIEGEEKKLEATKDFAEKRMDLEKELIDAQREFLLTAVDSVFSINQSANEKELEELQAQYDAKLAIIEKNEETGLYTKEAIESQKLKISKDYALKEEEIQRLRDHMSVQQKKSDELSAEIEKLKETMIKKYGVVHNSHIPAVAKAMSKSGWNFYEAIHWQTGEMLYCQGKLEREVVRWLNANKIPFSWQLVFKMPTGKTYRVDLYLTNEDKYIEIKGYFRNAMGKEKWEWFHSTYPNSELWMEPELRAMGIVGKKSELWKKGT